MSHLVPADCGELPNAFAGCEPPATAGSDVDQPAGTLRDTPKRDH